MTSRSASNNNAVVLTETPASTQHVPWHVRTQLLAAHLTVRQAFDARAPLRRDRPTTGRPLIDQNGVLGIRQPEPFRKDNSTPALARDPVFQLHGRGI